MTTQNQTNQYDVHLLFEAGYDEVPVLRAYELYKDEAGAWNSDSDDIANRYDFTNDDLTWLFKNLKDRHGAPYTDVYDLCLDDYFSNLNPDSFPLDCLPPKALAWVLELQHLPYTYTDLTKKDK